MGGRQQLPSELLQQIHKELCSNISIDSEEFTFFLIDEITRLKKELERVKGKGKNGMQSK